MREYKRLQRSNDQSPGYAMSRGYLETLADLPWSALASQRAAAPSRSAAPRDGDECKPSEPVGDGDSTGAADGSSSETVEEDRTEAVSASVPSTTAGEFIRSILQQPNDRNILTAK